jgi:hypothetical protein
VGRQATKLLTSDEARCDCGEGCEAAALLLSGPQYSSGFWIDKMNSPANGTRYGLVGRAID